MASAETIKKSTLSKKGYVRAIATQPVQHGNKLFVTLCLDYRIGDDEVIKAFRKIMAYHRAITPTTPVTEAEKAQRAFEDIFKEDE